MIRFHLRLVFWCVRDLGIETSVSAESDPKNFKTLAIMMFDTKLPPGVVVANPFGDDSVLTDISVKVLTRFPACQYGVVIIIITIC